jgi:sugar O-acyltransferase (sialic acid O-acetyltransferase NeuD family)
VTAGRQHPINTTVVLFGVGSPLVVDVEESVRRAGLRVAAAVRNCPGVVHLLDATTLIDAADVSPDLLEVPFLVPLFGPANRQAAAQEARALGFLTPAVLIDPSVAVPMSLEAAPGVYVNAGCSLGAATALGEFVYINRGASIGHHGRLERFVSVGPGAVIAGSVHIGRGAFIGAGAVVLPEIAIGENAVVGAGAVVTRPVPAHSLVVGAPARVIRTNVAGYGDASVK